MRKIELDKIWYFLSESLPYLRVTVAYVVISLVCGFVLGSLIARLRMSKNKLANLVGRLYVTITRCTPTLVLLFLVYYGIPAAIGGKLGAIMDTWPVLVFVCITFSIYIGASSSEIIRSAYEAIDKGQMEAGMSVGLSRTQTFLLVILPQMIRISIPNIGNTVIFMFKEGALGYTIGLYDVLGYAYKLNSKFMGAYVVDMYIALAIIYWCINVILERVFAQIEKAYTPERKHRAVIKPAAAGEA